MTALDLMFATAMIVECLAMVAWIVTMTVWLYRVVRRRPSQGPLYLMPWAGVLTLPTLAVAASALGWWVRVHVGAPAWPGALTTALWAGIGIALTVVRLWSARVARQVDAIMAETRLGRS